MSPVQHPVSGPALAFTLADELRTLHEELARTERRIGRTLVKDGPLRVTLVGLNPGGERAGALEFEAGEKRWPLTAGSLLALDAGITHSVRSERGGVFLLTVVKSSDQR